jgi:hypothetical protein
VCVCVCVCVCVYLKLCVNNEGPYECLLCLSCIYVVACVCVCVFPSKDFMTKMCVCMNLCIVEHEFEQ